MKYKVAQMFILFLLFVIPISQEALSGDLETIYDRKKWLEKTQERNKKQIELAERMIDNASYWLNRRDLLLLPTDLFGPVPVPRNLFTRRAEDLELDIRSKAFTGKITPYEAEERLLKIKRHIKDVEYADLKARKILQEIKTNVQEDIKNIKRSNEEIDREIAILKRQIKSLQSSGKDLGKPVTEPSSSVDRGTLKVPGWPWKLPEGEKLYYIIDCKEIVIKTGKTLGVPRRAWNRAELEMHMKTINNCSKTVEGRRISFKITVMRREPGGKDVVVTTRESAPPKP